MKSPSRMLSIGTLIFVGAFFAIPAFFQSYTYLTEQGFNIWHSKRLLLLMSYLLNIGACLIFVLWNTKKKTLRTTFSLKENSIQKPIGIILFLGSIILLPLLNFYDTNQFIARGFPLLWSAWWLAFLGASGLWLVFRTDLLRGFLFTLLFIGLLSRIASWGPSVSAYPLSIGWSEASRYYYASLVFSKKIFGTPLALSVWHPTRYLLQSIPFAFGDLPLLFHRMWQALLWTIISGASGIALANRINKKKTLTYFIFALWFFLYLFQGAVYYHLQIAVIIILIGVKRKNPRLSFLAILLASFWAGISRLNWYPIPAMLALTIYLLEEPVSNYKNWRHYLRTPILWTATGLATALASQSFYIFWSRNSTNISSFGSSLTSDLLWYRLLPNNTYPPGVILPVLIISLPLLGIIISALYKRSPYWHWLRLTALWLMLLVLFGGGLIVSTKIGGGGDLHNMDAYLVLLGIWASYFISGKAVSENPEKSATNTINALWIIPAIIIPLWISLQIMRPMPSYNIAQVENNLRRLKNSVLRATDQGGEVLFITQRHLLAIDWKGEIPLIEEYELITLMEMAMSGNRTYLDAFHKDLREHRFALIVTNPQFVTIKANEEAFSEENNAWTTEISRYLICEYKISENYKEIKTQILKPNTDPQTCSFGE
ncbi:MAG: hypothetical protein HN392_01155 [Anaerolineae bacterium]|nr:hypothetical protein [Anaerolineae bacterium]